MATASTTVSTNLHQGALTIVDYRSIDQVLDKLEDYTPTGPDERQYSACCPAHGDTRASLSIGLTPGGKLLLHCHAGCSFDEIYEALGKPPLDGYPPLEDSLKPQPSPPVRQPDAPDVLRTGYEAVIARLASGKLQCDPETSDDWPDQLDRLKVQGDDATIEAIAKSLGVDAWALKSLGAVWSVGNCLLCPEFDGQGYVCGVMVRNQDGQKRTLSKSRRGLYLSSALGELRGPIYCCEGLTDTAALLTMGLAAVGRPSASGGISALRYFLRMMPPERTIYVLGEMDAKSDGSWTGRDEARKAGQMLSDSLQREVQVTLPPDLAKDVRAWLLAARRPHEGEAA